MSKPRRFNPADALQAAAMARLHERIMGAGRAAEEGGRLRPGEAARALGDDAATDYAENEARPAPNGRSEDGSPRQDPVHMAKLTQAAGIRNAKIAGEHPEPDADDAGGPSDGDADNQVPNPAPRASMAERLRGALPAPEAGDDPEAARRAAIRERLLRETSSALAPLRGAGRSGL